MSKSESSPLRQLPRLLDRAGVAEHLAVSERHVRRFVAERRIPYVKWPAPLGSRSHPVRRVARRTSASTWGVGGRRRRS